MTSHTIRKASEDGRLRPFLSSHFDAQSYITSIIHDNRTEEFYHELASCIQDVELLCCTLEKSNDNIGS